MAIVPTGGDDVRFSDIQHWLIQDPVTKLWSTNGHTETAIAGYLNQDFRHYNDTRIEEVFRILSDEFQMIEKNLGVETDPANDSPQWFGMFDDYHRQLGDAGNRNKLMRQGWNSLLSKGQASTGLIKVVPDYVPRDTAQSDRRQQAGFVMEEWDQLCQSIAEGELDGNTSIPNRPYDPDDRSGYKNDGSAVHDQWVILTGGRRFGAVTEATITSVIDNQNNQEKINLNTEALTEIQGWGGKAYNAALAAFNANPTGETPANLKQIAKDDYASNPTS